MTLEMSRLEIIGLKSNLSAVLHSLRRLGCLHIEDINEAPEVSARSLVLEPETIRLQEELSFLASRIEGLIEVLGSDQTESPVTATNDYLVQARIGVESLAPKVQALTTRREKLRAELSSLPRYEVTLRKLLPLIPSSAQESGNVTVGVLVSSSHVGILDSMGKNILELTGGRAEVVASSIDASTHAMLVVFPKEFTEEIEALLGREDVSRLRLPAQLGEGPPDVILRQLHRRIVDIPEELGTIDLELAGLAAQWKAKLNMWREQLRDELDTNRALSFLGETDMTFVLVGWVPVKDLATVNETLISEVDETLLVRVLPITPELQKNAPVILQNPRLVKPFETLTNLLALPRYGHIDPTRLMAIFLPIFFGMILGDVGYGSLLLLSSLIMRIKFRQGIGHDIFSVLAMGSVWSIVFGFLYGEAFGTLGEHLGLHPLWFDRASPDHVMALLLMTVAIGAVHITLGLILGIWEAMKEKSKGHLMERGGMLLGLIALFFITGVLANLLPDNLMTPAIAFLLTGIALLGASMGWLGIMMGPIEFVGLIGNVLSYLRIAAIGLASVYLAKVANDLAGMIGNIFVGAIVAVLIHALNLVLGAFSPTIHSLRLHYVEFFRKFYQGGGREYAPFRSQPMLSHKKE